MGPKTIALITHNQHLDVRKMLLPAFSPKTILQYIPRKAEIAEQMCAEWAQRGQLKGEHAMKAFTGKVRLSKLSPARSGTQNRKQNAFFWNLSDWQPNVLSHDTAAKGPEADLSKGSQQFSAVLCRSAQQLTVILRVCTPVLVLPQCCDCCNWLARSYRTSTISVQASKGDIRLCLQSQTLMFCLHTDCF